MLLRFRLFSDPFANGWGWVIEDLKIIPLIDAKHEIVTWHVGIYPNPGHGLIKLSTDSPERESYNRFVTKYLMEWVFVL